MSPTRWKTHWSQLPTTPKLFPWKHFPLTGSDDKDREAAPRENTLDKVHIQP